MIGTNATNRLVCLTLFAVGLIFTFSVATVITQSPADSEGWHIPEGAAMESNPQSPDPEVLVKGRMLYKSKCQRCHGPDGTGHGPESDPRHPAANLTDGSRASRNPDGVMFYKIWNGRAKPKMPAMSMEITRPDVWVVILYVKTLRK
jgi:mono/diheme cytochrome c family protein